MSLASVLSPWALTNLPLNVMSSDSSFGLYFYRTIYLLRNWVSQLRADSFSLALRSFRSSQVSTVWKSKMSLKIKNEAIMTWAIQIKYLLTCGPRRFKFNHARTNVLWIPWSRVPVSHLSQQNTHMIRLRTINCQSVEFFFTWSVKARSWRHIKNGAIQC